MGLRGWVMLAVLGLCMLGLAGSAQAAPLGVTGFFGNPSTTGETVGGRFSTTPQGVAVNDTTGDVYVVDSGNHRIERFDSEGNFDWAVGFDVIAPGKTGNLPQNERQMVTINGAPTGGTFTLRYPINANSTVPIDYNATAAQVDAALEGLGTIGPGNVVVSVAPGGNLGGESGVAGGPWIVEFTGALADINVVEINGLASNLTPPGGKTVTITTLTEGAGFVEKCTVAADCKAGTPGVGATNRNFWGTPVPGGGMASPQGIAIDQVSGDLYLADAGYSRIQQLDSEGGFIRAWGRGVVQAGKVGDSPAASAVQTLTVDAAAGDFKLSFQGQSTADLDFDASAATVQAALAGLLNVGAGNVSVSGGPGSPGGVTPYTITFNGLLANNPEPLIVAADGLAPLSGGAASATVVNAVSGANGFEICNTAADCDRGVAGTFGGAFPEPALGMGYLAVAPAGAPNSGNVLIGDGNRRRVQEFSGSGSFVRTFGWDVVAAGPNNAGAGFEVCLAAEFDACREGTIGSGTGQFAITNPGVPNIRVAVDTTGAIYTVEPAGNFRVQKFTSAGNGLIPALYCPSIGGAETLCGSSAANRPVEIAVDPGDDHTYVTKSFPAGSGTPAASSAEVRVLEFDPGATLVETHLANYNVTAVNGMGVKSGGQPLYLSSPNPKAGVIVVDEPTPPHPTIAASTAIGAECATLNGSVNPEGGGPLHTFYRFEYSADNGANWSKAPAVDIDIASGTTPVAVQQSVCGLEPNKAYEVRLIATKGGAPVSSTGSAGDFTTDPAPPGVQTFAAFWDVNAGELVLRGSVNPNNTATTYYFEYGTEPCTSSACISVPESEDAAAGSGGKALTRSERLAGLEAATTYHFRIVADNGVGGPVIGGEETISTPAETGPCANEAVRVGASTNLPECRAFEWVSHGDSWGSGIGTVINSIADSGNRAQFTAQAFGQPDSVPGPSTPYNAERGDGGWTVRAMAPQATRADGSYSGTRFMGSADLGAVLWPQSSLGQRLRGEVRWGSIDLEGGESAVSGLLVPIEHSGMGSGGTEYPLIGAAADLSSLVFRHSSPARAVTLVAGEPLLNPGASNLYRAVDGGVEIVNRGGPPSPGNPLGVMGGACGARLGANVVTIETEPAEKAVSADGSTIHFSIRPGSPPAGSSCAGAGPKRLFKRLDGTTTVEVSACAKANPANCTTAGDDRYRGASRDGEVTFFLSPRQLTDTDTDTSEDLYVYDESLPPSERLIQASAGEVVAEDHPVVGAGAEVRNVLDNSADGSRVYFVAKGRLSAEAVKDPDTENLYVFERDAAHPGGRIGFVAALASGEASASATSYALPAGEDGDGRSFLFTSAARLLGEDADSSEDLYRYEDPSGELLCLSCMGEGGFDVKVTTKPPAEASWADYAQQARPASDDGSAVVFSTEEGLVDDDLNGANDAYLWQDGALSLVSVGSGQDGVQGSSVKAGVSPDGRDVFFITRTALVGSDVNNGLDLYDARIGGGFAEAPVQARCASAAECRPAQSSTPQGEGSGSDTFTGPGNPAQAKPCGKGKTRRGGKCVKKSKPHKGKKGKGKQKGKRAGNERGGKR